MKAPAIPDNEPARLASLRRLGLLDTEPEERFDRITRIAQQIFSVPIAVVNLVDADRVYTKAGDGFAGGSFPRRTAFCGHTIVGPDMLEVSDTTLDERFADNPFVTGDPNLRFYAGQPIAAPGGLAVGTLCIMDAAPRAPLTDSERGMLANLADLVERELAVARIAVDDELTGLANRLGFGVMAHQAMTWCVRQQRDGLVVFADVNRLKEVNDTQGHEAGDVLIRAAGEAMRRAFREADVVSRLGGDEFAAFLSLFEGDPGLVVERLATSVAEVNGELGLDPVPLSMAVGSAAYDHTSDDDLDTLLRVADEAMYRNKRPRVG